MCLSNRTELFTIKMIELVSFLRTPAFCFWFILVVKKRGNTPTATFSQPNNLLLDWTVFRSNTDEGNVVFEPKGICGVSILCVETSGCVDSAVLPSCTSFMSPAFAPSPCLLLSLHFHSTLLNHGSPPPPPPSFSVCVYEGIMGVLVSATI